MGNLAISLTFFTYLGEKYKQHKGGVFCCLLKHSEQPRGCDAVGQRARKGRLAAEMHPDSLALSNTLHSVSVKYPPNAEQFHLFSWASGQRMKLLWRREGHVLVLTAAFPLMRKLCPVSSLLPFHFCCLAAPENVI